MQSPALCSSSGSVLLASLVSFDCRNLRRCSSYFSHKLFDSRVRRHGSRLRHRVLRVRAVDDDSADIPSFNELADNSRPSMLSSNEGETGDGEVISTQTSEIELPTSEEELPPSHNSTGTNDAVLNNVGIMSFSTILLLLADLHAWRIVRLPLPEFHMIRPFLISSLLVSCVGCICVPLFRSLKLHSTVKKEVPVHHSHERGTPTLGGLYFVPVGILVAESVLNFSSIEVSGAAVATIAFAAIGLLDDFLTINNNNYGLPGWMRVFLSVALGMWLSNWFYTKHISTPYLLKMGKSYLLLTLFFFLSIPNGINLTDGLDGLAAGTAALAFIAMSIVVLPICCDLSVFGASMAGACIGFLFQNQYKASIFMGDMGSLALGGGLAAMASCTGMFVPLFIASGIFILEAFLVVIQEALFKVTKYLGGRGHRLFQMAPLHHHFELCGIKQQVIVAAAYVAACLLSLCAAYMGLTSARISKETMKRVVDRPRLRGWCSRTKVGLFACTGHGLGLFYDVPTSLQEIFVLKSNNGGEHSWKKVKDDNIGKMMIVMGHHHSVPVFLANEGEAIVFQVWPEFCKRFLIYNKRESSLEEIRNNDLHLEAVNFTEFIPVYENLFFTSVENGGRGFQAS